MNIIKNLPINVDLISVKENELSKLSGKIEESVIFDSTGKFHPKGLFSVEIFGPIGSELRNRLFGYIDLNIEILHPLIYYAIISLKSFYKDILAGNQLAIWDNNTKQFIKSNDIDSNTGYDFFFKHIKELKFEETGSYKREHLIKIFNKAIEEDKYILRYHLVIPAGLRDYTIDSSGKPQEDEINSYYRKLISSSTIIDKNIAKKTPEIYDNARFILQENSLTIFNYFKNMLEGKSKLILGKWLTRKIFNTTRNVATSAIEKVNNINDKNRLGYNDTYVGLHQFLRTIVPKSIYEIKNKYIKDIFIENNNFAYLTNVKTLKKETVNNYDIQKDYDLWSTFDGIEKVIANFGNIDLRHLPIYLNKGNHSLGLIYKDNKYFKFFQDIDELPKEFSKDNVSLITFAEFLYLSVYHLDSKIPALLTRYPITGYGSIYPTYMKIKTTVESDILTELDNNWQPTNNIAYNFPIRNTEFFNTMSPHPSRLALLGADFDGDMLSLQALLTDEAIEEINKTLNSKEFYISPENKFYFSFEIDTLDAVLSYMTN